MLVSELSGTMLDYWVAKIAPQCDGCGITHIADHAAGPHYVGSCADGVAFFIPTNGIAQVLRLKREYDGASAWRPHMDWAHGGPIIEREELCLDFEGDGWGAYFTTNSPDNRMGGPTPLTAAMRAYVASKYGNTVPDDPA